jgi:hypothetical protein
MSEFGTCKFCGADNVKSPKTQKIFCSAKCWLNKKPEPRGYGSNETAVQERAVAEPSEFEMKVLAAFKVVNDNIKTAIEMIKPIKEKVSNIQQFFIDSENAKKQPEDDGEIELPEELK